MRIDITKPPSSENPKKNGPDLSSNFPLARHERCDVYFGARETVGGSSVSSGCWGEDSNHEYEWARTLPRSRPFAFPASHPRQYFDAACYNSPSQEERVPWSSSNMNISEYRREFAAFNSSLELARYRHHAGLEPGLETREVFERYSDLFTPQAVADLCLLYDQAPVALETERTAIRRLLSVARFWHLELRAGKLTEELACCQSSSHLEWNGKSLSIRDVPRLLAREPDKACRRELTAQFVAAVSACDDLRAERLELLHKSACEFGLGSYKDLFQGHGATDYRGLLRDADSFLQRTRSAYASALADAVARHLGGISVKDLHQADYLFLAEMPSLRKFFPSKNLISAYADTIGGLGIESRKQLNLKIEGDTRPGKDAEAAYFRVDPPEDVRVVFAPAEGLATYRNFFHAAGKAQHHAWCSADLARRYPEFIYSLDSAMTEGYGFLFTNLLIDAKWLPEHLSNVSQTQARAMARDLALLVLHDVRLWCAAMSYEGLQAVRDKSSGQVQLAYTEIMAEATGFQFNPGLYLFEADITLHSATRLRAMAFAFAMIEFLRTRYGGRWWTSRRAGEELRDVWNTASRYSVEEIARLVGLGEISLDFVGDSLLAAIREV
jgi:hypothetical protein